MTRVTWALTIIVLLLTGCWPAMVWAQVAAGESSPTITEESITPEEYFATKAKLVMWTDTIVKQCLHGVQLGVERYAIDQPSVVRDGNRIDFVFYPLNMAQVIDGGYITSGFYANPVTADSMTDCDAKAVSVGPWSPERAGNFSYIPYIGKSGKPEGYMMVGYGSTQDSAVCDIPGVVIFLLSGVETLPDAWVNEVLKQLRPTNLDALIQQTFRQ